MTLGKPRVPVAIAVGVAAVVLLANDLSSFHLFLGTLAAANAVIAMSVGATFGYAGVSSLCQLSFAELGAWFMARLLIHGAVPFPVAVLAGGVAAAAGGALLGLLARRLRSIDLMVATLAFALAVQQVVGNVGFPGEGGGFFVARPAWLASDQRYFMAAWATFAILALGLHVLAGRRLGHSWRSIKRSERAAAAMGIRPVRVRLIAFAVGAGFAGVGGAILLGLQGVVAQQTFAPVASLTIFLAAVMAGAQYLEGAILAGVFSVVVPELLTSLGLPSDLNALLFAVGAVQVLAKGGNGIAGDLRSGLRAIGRRITDRRGSPALVESVASTRLAVVPAVRVNGTPRSDHVLELRAVSVHYAGVPALAEVDLDIRAGEVAALIGPNGAGKSTLVDVVTGFNPRHTGAVRLDGTSTRGWSPQRFAERGVRRTFQHERTVPELRIGEFLGLSARSRPGDPFLDEVAGLFGLPGLDPLIGSLDVGTRRVVELAACVAARPVLLLLDEPAAGLGEEQVASLMTAITELPERIGCGVLLIEHDMRLVRSLCSTVTVLNFGSVIANGAPGAVLGEQRVLDAYLGDKVS